jgi:arylsulfatase A
LTLGKAKNNLAQTIELSEIRDRKQRQVRVMTIKNQSHRSRGLFASQKSSSEIRAVKRNSTFARFRRDVLFCASVGLPMLVLASDARAQESKEHRHPNIVLIVADDLGYGDFSCYGDGKTSTPTVDSLAATGIQFRDAYAAASICSPSRYSILTGRYSWRSRLKFGVLSWFAKPLIAPDRTTLASLLKRDGYDTACVGKWHLGFNWVLKTNAPADPDKTVFETWDRTSQDYIDFSKPVTGGPLDRGFDYFYGIAGSINMMPYVLIENNRVLEPPSVPKHVYEFDQNTLKAPDWHSRTLNQDLTKKAVAVINNHFAKHDGKPLFLYFPTSAIHRPCLPTFTKGKTHAGLVGDMVLEFDWTVGQIVEALKQNSAFNDTLLIITSDNGPYPGDPLWGIEKYKTEDFAKDLWLNYFNDYTNQAQYINPYYKRSELWKTGWLTYGHKTADDFLGFKEDAWEGGLRVPLVVHWPDEIKTARTNYDTVCLVDLLATFADLEGNQLKQGEGEDSYSFLPYLFNPDAPQVRKSLVACAGGSGALVVRRGYWIYIQAAPNPHWEKTYWPLSRRIKQEQLYNLSDDPSEHDNLFDSKPQVAEKLKRIIARVQQHVKTEGISN